MAEADRGPAEEDQGAERDLNPRAEGGARWRNVATSGGLPLRSLREVEVAGRRIVLARLEDSSVAACEARCPHQQSPLGEGSVYMGCIECPRHHYLYDLRTGQNRYPREVFPAEMAAALAPLRLYPVRERDECIWVRID